MNTTSTIATNAFDSYDSSSCAIQQQAQAQYQQQQYPSLNQEQLYDASAHPGSIWEKQHQNITSSTPIPPHIRGQYYSLYSNTSVQNGTRNIKTEDESPVFVGSAADFSKMTTNNKYGNDSSLENDGYLNLIKKSSNPSIPAEDKYSDQNEGYEQVEQCDDTHGNNRTCSTRNVVEKKRYRRESHNAVERRRRNNINDNIRNLGLLLPENMCQVIQVQGKVGAPQIRSGCPESSLLSSAASVRFNHAQDQ